MGKRYTLYKPKVYVPGIIIQLINQSIKQGTNQLIIKSSKHLFLTN